MSADDVKENLKNTGEWTRVLYILLFIVIFLVARFVLWMIVVFQVGHVLITGQKNDRVLKWSSNLAKYMYQIVCYITYTSEQKPFPFTDYPEAGETPPV